MATLCGTSDDQLFSGDVVRKLLVKMETQADLSQPVRLPPPEPSVSVKVRERASRRAVKQAAETAEAEARAYKVAEQLVDWYNQHVGGSMVQYARLGKGRRMHILDMTHIEIPVVGNWHAEEGLRHALNRDKGPEALVGGCHKPGSLMGALILPAIEEVVIQDSRCIEDLRLRHYRQLEGQGSPDAVIVASQR